MSLIGIQRRMRELGRIRLGEKGVTKNGKSYPKKLTGFRLTSQSHPLLLVAADLYGGEVRKWEGAPGLGDQWELYMGDRIDVLLPPGEPLTQSFELWSGGGCVRRCNGMVMADGGPCQCPADLNDRIDLAKTGEACKPTTRLAVILPRLPDIGVWRMETHGYNAAVELPGTVDLLKVLSADGRLIPAFLRIEQRTSVKDGETRHFVVPVLELPTVTVAELQAGATTPALAAVPTPAVSPVPSARPQPSLPAPRPARSEQAQRPVEPPPLPGDTHPTTALADGISGLCERLGALGDWALLRFTDKFGDPEKLPASRLVVAEAYVTSMEKQPPPGGASAPVPTPEGGHDETTADVETGEVRQPALTSVPSDEHPSQGRKPRATRTPGQLLHIEASRHGISEDDLDVLILHATNGRTDSANDVTTREDNVVRAEMEAGPDRLDRIRQAVAERFPDRVAS